MRNVLRVVAMLALICCAAGLMFAEKQGKEKSNGSPVLSVQAPFEVAGGTDLLKEGFNDTSATGFPPAGWIMINNDHGAPTGSDPSDTCWYESVTVGGSLALPLIEGVGCAAAYYGTSNGLLLDDWLVTPNTGGAGPAGSVDSLTFWMVSRLSSSGSYPDSLDIRVSSTNKAVGSFTRLVYLNVPKTAWTRVALALPQSAVRYVAFRYLMYDGGSTGDNSDKICVDDVHITRYSSTAVGSPAGFVPQSYVVNQNYPNPFNPSTQITFGLPAAGHVTLRVVDALGRAVSTLVDEELSAGMHARTFDASRLAGGVYFYRLTAGNYASVHQMLLIK